MRRHFSREGLGHGHSLNVTSSKDAKPTLTSKTFKILLIVPHLVNKVEVVVDYEKQHCKDVRLEYEEVDTCRVAHWRASVAYDI